MFTKTRCWKLGNPPPFTQKNNLFLNYINFNIFGA